MVSSNSLERRATVEVSRSMVSIPTVASSENQLPASPRSKPSARSTFLPRTLARNTLGLRTFVFRRNANVRNPSVFRAKVRGKNVDLADGFERGLAGSWFSEDATVGMLTIDRETSTVALRSKEFELTIRGSLGNIGIQIEEGIDIAAVARKLSNSFTARSEERRVGK